MKEGSNGCRDQMVIGGSNGATLVQEGPQMNTLPDQTYATTIIVTIYLDFSSYPATPYIYIYGVNHIC